jgi:hypothetical protein
VQSYALQLLVLTSLSGHFFLKVIAAYHEALRQRKIKKTGKKSCSTAYLLGGGRKKKKNA